MLNNAKQYKGKSKQAKNIGKNQEEAPTVRIKKITAIGEVQIIFGGNLWKLNSSSIQDYKSDLIVVHVSKRDNSMTIGSPKGSNQTAITIPSSSFTSIDEEGASS